MQAAGQPNARQRCGRRLGIMVGQELLLQQGLCEGKPTILVNQQQLGTSAVFENQVSRAIFRIGGIQDDPQSPRSLVSSRFIKFHRHQPPQKKEAQLPGLILPHSSCSTPPSHKSTTNPRRAQKTLPQLLRKIHQPSTDHVSLTYILVSGTYSSSLQPSILTFTKWTDAPSTLSFHSQPSATLDIKQRELAIFNTLSGHYHIPPSQTNIHSCG